MRKPLINREQFQECMSKMCGYVPPFVILVFGMLALHFSVRLIDVADAPGSAQTEQWLYWSVIALSLSAFLLVLVNSEQVRQIRAAGEEKKKNIRLLAERLAAMESTQDGIGIVDRDGRLAYMNKALLKLHGILPDQAHEYIGKSWFGLYNERGQQQIRDDVMPALEREGFWQGESPMPRQDGSVAIVEFSLTRLPEGGFIGTARDITEKRRTEKEKEALQSQFFQAQKMEAIGRLSGGIAHDFNNILAAINGFAEFLIEDLEEESRQHKFARNILDAGTQARDLVDQILSFSRRSDHFTGSADLVEELERTVSMLKAGLPRTIDLHEDISLSRAPVRGNPAQIAQIIMNLSVNAKDAMDDGHGTLSITLRGHEPGSDMLRSFPATRPGLQDGGFFPITIEDASPESTILVLGAVDKSLSYAELAVGDTGCGMGRVVMEHMFEPFFTTKPVDKGTGLGLSTVHGVLLGLGGAMMVESHVGKGTVFRILFPLLDGEVVLNEVLREENYDFSGLRALLVEDQPEVREMMTVMMSRLGFEVESCETGIEALEEIRDGLDDYDIVIADHNMPRMTGLEMAVQIAADFPDLPVVLVSGYSHQQLQDLMHECPSIREVLRKPVEKDVFASKVGGVLGKARMIRRPAA